jgi:hypothetical protein
MAMRFMVTFLGSDRLFRPARRAVNGADAALTEQRMKTAIPLTRHLPTGPILGDCPGYPVYDRRGSSENSRTPQPGPWRRSDDAENAKDVLDRARLITDTEEYQALYARIGAREGQVPRIADHWIHHNIVGPSAKTRSACKE